MPLFLIENKSYSFAARHMFEYTFIQHVAAARRRRRSIFSSSKTMTTNPKQNYTYILQCKALKPRTKARQCLNVGKTCASLAKFSTRLLSLRRETGAFTCVYLCTSLSTFVDKIRRCSKMHLMDT